MPAYCLFLDASPFDLFFLPNIRATFGTVAFAWQSVSVSAAEPGQTGNRIPSGSSGVFPTRNWSASLRAMTDFDKHAGPKQQPTRARPLISADTEFAFRLTFSANGRTSADHPARPRFLCACPTCHRPKLLSRCSCFVAALRKPEL